MAVNPMNTLIIIENIFCVNRNYCVLTKPQRFILFLRLLLELALLGIPLVQFHFKVGADLPKSEFLYFSLTVVSTFSIIILAMYHTKNFQNLKYRIEKTHVYFAKDTVYSRNLNRRFKFTSFVAVIYVILMGAIVVIVNILTKSTHIVGYLYHVIMLFYNFRYIFEFIVLHSVLILLSEQIECIIRKISNERKLILNEDDEDEDEDIVMNGGMVPEVTGFDEWTQVYMNIKECSNLINTVFGVQITVTLTSMIFFFIIFLYVITYMSISGNIILSTILVYTVKVIVLLISLYALSRGAQTAENSVRDLRRCLGKLLIYSPIEDASYKPIKDFLRLVTNRPIKTQAFGSISVDMTLVPKFVMFFTSYTVIALQFNNVV